MLGEWSAQEGLFIWIGWIGWSWGLKCTFSWVEWDILSNKWFKIGKLVDTESVLRKFDKMGNLR